MQYYVRISKNISDNEANMNTGKLSALVDKQTLAAILFLVIFITLIVFSGSFSNKIQQAPDISLNIIDGNNIALKQLRGKPVLITFWATSCSVCVNEIQDLITLYDEFSAHGFEIIGISMPYDQPRHVIEMINERSIPYPVALDISGHAGLAFGDILATPTSFLIAPDGKIAIQVTGKMNFDKLRHAVASMLAEQNLSNHTRPSAVIFS